MVVTNNRTASTDMILGDDTTMVYLFLVWSCLCPWSSQKRDGRESFTTHELGFVSVIFGTAMVVEFTYGGNQLKRTDFEEKRTNNLKWWYRKSWCVVAEQQQSTFDSGQCTIELLLSIVSIDQGWLFGFMLCFPLLMWVMKGKKGGIQIFHCGCSRWFCDVWKGEKDTFRLGEWLMRQLSDK